jgi:hypothetical protein
VDKLVRNWVGERESFLDPESFSSLLSSERVRSDSSSSSFARSSLLFLALSSFFVSFLASLVQPMKTTWKKRRESCPMPPVLLLIPM